MQQASTLTRPDNGFDLKAWRQLLFDTAHMSGESVQVINPFGFEVLRDRSFLMRGLNNFYIYLGTTYKRDVSVEALYQSFTDHLISQLMLKYPRFFHEILVILTPHSRVVHEAMGTRSIYIRHIPCRGSLINTYARYILATIGGITEGNIKAVSAFDYDPLSRRYLFQLCIILEAVFKDIAGELASDNRRTLMNLIRQLHSAEIQGLSRTDSHPNDAELTAFREIVLPYVSQMKRIVRRTREIGDKVKLISARDFHGSNMLTLRISQKLLAEKTDFIVSSYTTFL